MVFLGIVCALAAVLGGVARAVSKKGSLLPLAAVIAAITAPATAVFAYYVWAFTQSDHYAALIGAVIGPLAILFAGYAGALLGYFAVRAASGFRTSTRTEPRETP